MASLLLVASHSQRDRWVGGLEAQGHAVILALDSVHAADRLREGGIDLVLVDYEVDGGVGELIEVMHRLPDPAPFVLLSSAPDAPVVSARLGAAAFVPKPFPIEELARVLGELLPSIPRAVLDEPPTRPVER